jgi:predicted acyl esterase
VIQGEIYELAVELWPTSIIIPTGYILALTIGGQDFDHGRKGEMPKIYGVEQRGSSVYLHDHPEDRISENLTGEVKIYTGGEWRSRLLLPLIPD